ncbi:aspartyl protease family protein [Flavobacterium subsaxonicum]|uniref:PDZ domain-containing protein n=1 Tax=Flavobacterium subsaxonicum WB 4.1-42 = DSM 21790 TaxID=1121898 RepID=A0A0A2MV36_9FLAO|nr:aspartyl protease family protein [Flavobacterium subsaxonicum]KGO92080.1 hypothetical protein Q766_14400 [Flavobacterium subsaxonicum WB 4.1-42 = DSM 21790]
MALQNVVYLLFGLCCAVAFAQGGEDMPVFKPLKATTTNAKDFYYEIPFEYPGAIILKVGVGGTIYNFGLDTGGYTMITDALQKACNFIIIKNELLGSTNGLTKPTNIVRADSLAIGNLVFNDVEAYQVNFDNSPTAQCLMDGGLIGSAILKNYIWQIDYPNKKIIVTDRISKLKSLDKATKVHVHLNSHYQPYFMAQLNGHFQWFMFDTGCSSLLYLDPKDAAKYTAEATAHAKILGGTVETHHGRVKDTINVFKADFEMGNLKLTGKPVHYRAGSGLNLVGSPIIKNYIVTLDFEDEALYFEPIEGAEPKDGWQRFGFSLEYEAGICKVATIIQGSQPDKLGLKPGDVVTAINNLKITCADYCDCRETFRAMLETESVLTLTVQQNGKPKKIIIKKEKFF